MLTDEQRNLNNCFAYDLVPSPSVIISALRAARRVNDFPSAVRVFEGTILQSSLPTLFAADMSLCPHLTYTSTSTHVNLI